MSRRPWVMLGWSLLIQLCVALVGRSIGPLAMFIGQDFHLSKAQIGLLPSALFFGQMLICIPAGWYVDKVGTQRMMVMVTAVLGAAFLCASFAPWYWLVLVCVSIGGCGYGAMHPASTRGVILWFSKEQSGTAMGLKQMGVTGGSALSALLLLPIANAENWRLAFTVAALLLVGLGGFSSWMYRDPLPAEPNRRTRTAFWPALLMMMRNKVLMGVSTAAVALSAVQVCLTTYLVLFLTTVVHAPLSVAGGLFVLSEASGTIGRIVWGIVSHRVFGDARIPVLATVAVWNALCCMGMANTPPHQSMWLLVLLVGLFGFSASGFNGIWLNGAAESVPQNVAGFASGLSVTIGSLGVILGPPCFGALVDATGHYAVPWMWMAGAMCITFLFLLWIHWKWESGSVLLDIAQ